MATHLSELQRICQKYPNQITGTSYDACPYVWGIGREAYDAFARNRSMHCKWHKKRPDGSWLIQVHSGGCGGCWHSGGEMMW